MEIDYLPVFLEIKPFEKIDKLWSILKEIL